MAKKKGLGSFHGDPAVKKMFLARVKEHEKAYRIKQQQGYWRDGKGCSVGCTVELKSGQFDVHEQYSLQLGLPKWLAWFEDKFFELMPAEHARGFPAKFLRAIPIGVDVPRTVLVEFLHWSLVDKKHGVINLVKEERFRQQHDAVMGVAVVLEKILRGELCASAAESAARSAASAARSAAWSAAWSAARSAAWSAARSAASAARSAASAAESAASAAESAASAASAAESAASAARSAARSAAWSAARSAAWSAMIKKFLSLLRKLKRE